MLFKKDHACPYAPSRRGFTVCKSKLSTFISLHCASVIFVMHTFMSIVPYFSYIDFCILRLVPLHVFTGMLVKEASRPVIIHDVTKWPLLPENWPVAISGRQSERFHWRQNKGLGLQQINTGMVSHEGLEKYASINQATSTTIRMKLPLKVKSSPDFCWFQ